MPSSKRIGFEVGGFIFANEQQYVCQTPLKAQREPDENFISGREFQNRSFLIYSSVGAAEKTRESKTWPLNTADKTIYTSINAYK